MFVRMLSIVLILGAACAPVLSSSYPSIDFEETLEEDALIIEAEVTDIDGNLATATLYVWDEASRDAIWVERRIIEGEKANVSFIWPLQSWRITNGSDFVEPVLAVNTIDMPPEEAPFQAISASCILKLYPESVNVTVLAYFDQNGEFHSLTDLSGNIYYLSRELFLVNEPGSSYGKYVLNNISLSVGLTTLSFLRLNLDRGLMSHQPLVLERSPIHHYTVRLEKRDIIPGGYLLEVVADDLDGQRTRQLHNILI